MMNKLLLLLCFCCTLCVYPRKAEAQILKKIGKKIEKSVENRVDRKVNQGIEKGLDKAEDGTEKVVADAVSSEKKSEFIALPEDYQIEITGSGPDVYVEYRMYVQEAEAEANQMNMSMKLYASSATGQGRAETIMDIPMLGEMRMAVLTDMNNPERVTMLNERKKQYTVMDFSTTEEGKKGKPDNEVYKVTKLGVVNVRGVECIHSEAVGDDGQRFEIWTTREIPGYEDMAALYSKSQQMGSDNLWKAMEDVGSAGIMVKLKVNTDGATTVMELVKMQKTNVPASTFSIPAGYKETKGGWMSGMMNR